MAKKTTQKRSSDVLNYRGVKISQSTLRRYYLQWRKEQGLPERCDNEKCRFYTEPLIWVDKPLKLVLDHRNGVNSYNRPENLRLLCPNCNSQLHTQGGGNKGRVEKSPGGFAIRRQDGKRDYTLPAESGHYKIG